MPTPLNPDAARIETPGLLPEDGPKEIFHRIHDLDTKTALAIVGHEPHLGALASWLIRGKQTRSFIEMKKGAVLALESAPEVHKKSGFPRWCVCWHLHPALISAARPMTLDTLPDRHGGAAENMAADFLLLKRYPHPTNARFRHYGWQRPAFTFGYSQKLSYVQQQLPAGQRVELCRRPTGGGVVDHRMDWTYALIVPAGHPLFDARATESYRLVHAAIAKLLENCGEPVELKEACETEGAPCAAGPSVCFERPERYDVVNRLSGRKVAGAAQKRTREGLLFQGSIDRQAVASSLDWSTFRETFCEALAHLLHTSVSPSPWPDFAEGEWEGLTENYSSPEWNELR